MADVPEGVILVSESEKRSDELEKRWDKYFNEPWQKRGSSSGSNTAPPVGELPADQELATNSDPSSPSSQTGPSRITQNAGSVSSPDFKQLPSDENYYASDEGGPNPGGLAKSYSDSSSNTRILGVGSNPGGSPGSAKSYPLWSPPELTSDMGGRWPTKNYPPSDAGPKADDPAASNEGTSTRPATGSIMNHPPSNRPEMGSTSPSFPLWDPHDWSDSSSEAEPEPNFLSKTKDAFDKLVYKFKFWPRGPEVL